MSNGYTAAADELAATLEQNPGAVLPADTWGDVTVSSISLSTANITVPPEWLTAPSESDDKTGLIVGLAVGRESCCWACCWRGMRCMSAPADAH